MGGRQDLETTVEFVPRPRQQGLSLAGSLARPSPAKMAPFLTGPDIPGLAKEKAGISASL